MHANVRGGRGGGNKPHAVKNRGVGNRHFCGRPLWTTPSGDSGGVFEANGVRRWRNPREMSKPLIAFMQGVIFAGEIGGSTV